MRKLPISLVPLLLLASVPALAQRRGPPPPPPPPSVRCVSSTIAVGLATWEPTPYPATFAADLEAAVSGLVPAAWFCDPNDVVCLSSVVPEVEVQALFPTFNTGISGVDKLSGSYYRVGYRDAVTGDRIKVRKDAMCAAIAQVSGHVYQMHGNGDAVRVNWECALESTSVTYREAVAANMSIETWARDRVGAPATVPAPNPAIDGPGVVKVAVIDSEVPPAYHAALGIESSYDIPWGTGEDPASTPISHGASVVSLIRNVDPDAVVRVYNVLDSKGMATCGGTAVGLMTALMQHRDGPAGPLVANISLGMVSALEHGAMIEGSNGGACYWYEDGACSELQAALVASRLLSSASHPVMTVAAAGNKVEPTDLTKFKTGLNQVHNTPCGLPYHGGQTMDFPADAARVGLCGENQTMIKWPLAVGAIDSHNRPASVTRETPLTTLYAPGEHVSVGGVPGMPVDTDDFMCMSMDPAVTPFQGGLKSGTSLASALVSGILAYGYKVAGQLGLTVTPGTMARLLYYSGYETSMVGIDGLTSAVANRARLEQALNCPMLVACAGYGSEDVPLDASLQWSCYSERAACGLLWTQAPSVQVSLPNLMDRITDPNHPQALTIQGGEDVCGEICGDAGYSCNPTAPQPVVQETTHLVRLNPQPGAGACPQCLMVIFPSENWIEAALQMELDPEIPEGSEFYDPAVTIRDEYGDEVVRVDLTPMTEVAEWKAGAAVVIEAVDLTAACEGNGTCESAIEDALSSPELFKVDLEVMLAPPGENGALDVSALSLQLP